MRPPLAIVAMALLVTASAACSEDAAVSIATEVAEGLGADPACVATVASVVRASVDASDELVDGQDEDVSSVLEALEAFVGAAPEELRAEAATLFDAYAALARAEDAGDTAAEAEARTFLDGPEVAAARGALGDWFDEHCTPDDRATTTTLR